MVLAVPSTSHLDLHGDVVSWGGTSCMSGRTNTLRSHILTDPLFLDGMRIGGLMQLY